MKEICDKKNELIISHRVHRNTVNHDSLCEQKVTLSLALFFAELTKVLELEGGEKAKLTCKILSFVNKYTMQPLTTTDANKGNLKPEVKPFYLQKTKD